MTTMIGLLSNVHLQLDPPEYTVRTVINPVPGPDKKFAFRVLGHRSPTAWKNNSGNGNLRIGYEDRLPTDVQANFHIYEPGTIIIRQGDTADRFYVLLKGKVDVFKENPNQPERRVAQITPASYFGEIGLLKHVKRTATVRVAEDSDPVELLSLDWHTFMYLVNHYDLTSAEIMTLVLRQHNESNDFAF
jgi:CRP-like cAMP-binding protein